MNNYFRNNNTTNNEIANINEYKYPPGNLNYTDKRIITKHICIDSVFRQNYNTTKSTDFIYSLPFQINNIISMKVSTVELLNNIYTFSSINRSNEFTVMIISEYYDKSDNNTKTQTVCHRVVIPEGSYQSDNLRDIMNNIFANIGLGLQNIYFDINNYNTRSCFRTRSTLEEDTIDPAKIYGNIGVNNNSNSYFLDSTKFIIDFTVYDYEFNSNGTVKLDENNEPIVITILDRPSSMNAGWMLGFRDSQYVMEYIPEGVVDLIVSNRKPVYYWYLQSESSYGSEISNYVYIDIDDYNKNYSPNTFIIKNHTDNYLGNNIIGRLTIDGGINTIITNNNSDCVFKKREYFGPVKLEKLHIRLLDKYSSVLNLNNNDISILLELEQIYS